MKIEVYIALSNLEVVNGCGQKNKNFDKLLDEISNLLEYDDNKWESLAQRLRLEACGPHDMDYHDGGTGFDKNIADILFVVRAYRLLDWTDWKIRYFVVIPALFKLFLEFRREWKKTFNFRKKSI